MRDYSPAQVKNIGVFAHSHAGKTTLVESMLLGTGILNRKGRVEDGNTTSDYLPEEVKRRVTTNATVVPVEYSDCKVNIIDTPGFGDFIGEVNSTMRVVDGTIFVICGVSGVEIQTEVYWEMCDANNLPRIIMINKLDRENANWERVLDQIQLAFGNKAFPMALPIGKADTFRGVINLLDGRAYGPDGKVMEVPDELRDEVQDYQNKLIELAVEYDDELLMKYLDGEPVSISDIRSGIASGISSGQIYPVLCGSASADIGVKLILELISQFLVVDPSTRDEGASFSGMVFKTVFDAYVGKLSYVKIFSGSIQSGENVIFNSTKNKAEKVTNLLATRGKQQFPRNCAVAGDIIAIPKLQFTSTGDSLCSKDAAMCFPSIDFPAPVYALSISPKTKADEDKLGNALAKLMEEDSTLKVTKQHETKETLLWGMGDVHLDVVLERLKNRYNVGVHAQEPKVPYRETISNSVKVEGKHKKQSGGHGQYGHVWLSLQPLTQGEFEFGEEIFGGSVPKQYIPAVEKGVREAMLEGAMAGYPVTGIKVILYDGSYHTVDSSELAFKVAAAQAVKKGLQQAKAIILEPVMKIEVQVPEYQLGDILSDLNTKRARVLGMEPRGGKQHIKAMVPFSEMRRYAIDLKALTQGRACFSMEFDHYDEVPPRLAESILKQRNML